MGKAARSFCQMASGEKASQSCLSLDTLLIRTPFLRLCVCMPFLVPLPLCWEGTARHPYLAQFLLPACKSGILFFQFTIIPFSLLCQKWRKVMERWENGETGALPDKRCSGSTVQRGTGSAWVSATTFPRLVHVCHMALFLSWSIFSNFQSFLEKKKTTITLTLLQRQDPMEAEGCPLKFSVRCKHLSGFYLPLQMLCPPRHS